MDVDHRFWFKKMNLLLEITKQDLKENPMENGVLKLTLSDKNLSLTSRKNTYTKEQYEKGFALDYSKILRNETSPFTYMKTLNYADNILEKRLAKQRGYDEPVFLNSPEFPVSESKSIDWQMFHPAEIQEKERIFLSGLSVHLKIRQCFVLPILFQTLQAQTSNHHLDLRM